MYPDGSIHDKDGWPVERSYGKINSPDTIGPSYSKDVTYTGEVMGNYANGSVGDSYGMIYTTNNKFKFRSPTSYRSLSEDGTYWEDKTNIAFYLYNGGDCSDGFRGGGFVGNSYGRVKTLRTSSTMIDIMNIK